MNYNPRKSINTAIFFALLLSIIIYGFFQARNLIAGPYIEVTSPLNGSVLNAPEIEIKGIAKNIAFINLNDRQIFVDDEGYFNEKLIAQSGYNIIKLTAEDKFKRHAQKLIEVIYNAPAEDIGDTSSEIESGVEEDEIIENKLEENI